MIKKRLTIVIFPVLMIFIFCNFVFPPRNGDVNCDGKINIVDALLIAQYVVGLKSDFGPCGDKITFPDANLEQAVRDRINKPEGDIGSEDVYTLTELHGRSSNISDLSGLEHFASLKSLNLPGNNITDLSPLAGLTKLTELNLAENKISSLEPLSGLPALKKLVLGGNQISKPEPLSRLCLLTELYLEENLITDFKALPCRRIKIQ